MEKSVKDANVYDKFQFERIGFFSVDPDASKKKVSFYLNEAENLQFLWLEIISNPSLPPPRKGEVVNKWRFSNSLNQNTSICARCCFFIEHLECYNGSCLITQCSFLWGGALRDNIKTAVWETTSLECSNQWLQISDMGGATLVTPFKLFTE